jgi:hypothetical protein
MQDSIGRKCTHHHILVQNQVRDRTLLYSIVRPATHYVVQQRTRPHIFVQQNVANKQLRKVSKCTHHNILLQNKVRDRTLLYSKTRLDTRAQVYSNVWQRNAGEYRKEKYISPHYRNKMYTPPFSVAEQSAKPHIVAQ